MLAVALGPQLVTLVTGSADAPSDGPSSSCCPGGGPIGMLSVLGLRPWSRQVWVVDAYVLLELLQGVVRALC
jgi:hypothetical protein